MNGNNGLDGTNGDGNNNVRYVDCGFGYHHVVSVWCMMEKISIFLHGARCLEQILIFWKTKNANKYCFYLLHYLYLWFSFLSCLLHLMHLSILWNWTKLFGTQSSLISFIDTQNWFYFLLLFFDRTFPSWLTFLKLDFENPNPTL